MPRNVEIKARVADLAAVAQRVLSLADGPREVIDQIDTYYHVVAGRLKLREFADGSGELIHYRRPDAPGPRPSHYFLVPVADASALAAVLEQVLPVRGVVRKRRSLLMIGRTRVHLDDVAGLGAFVELEVVLDAGEDPAAGRSTAERLMEILGIAEEELVPQGYIDLLEAGAAAT